MSDYRGMIYGIRQLMEPTFNGENVPELDMFLFCGEELTKKTAESLLDRFPNARIYNTYGPTIKAM
ncbi:hypothetical protein [Enterococcus faecium]|uniref:hypothetical protein n=1 Tax=Enterococcus faecium TaxID=1352 RepID=UPI0022362631|nr:hypothetical protein [Enterococcus faecium]